MDNDLTVDLVRIAQLDIDLPRAFVGSTYEHRTRSTFVTEIGLSDGTTIAATSGHGHANPSKVHAWTRTLGALVVGRPLHGGEATWRTMLARASASSPLEFPYAMGALAVLDIALWNARGVVLGEPICRLLGAEREPIPTMLIGGYYSGAGTTDDVSALAHAAVDAGATAVKLKVGGGTSIRDDVAKLEAFLDVAAGSGLTIVCDANRAWGAKQAAEFVRTVGPHDRIAWIEEPLQADLERVEGPRLHALSPLPICSGQSESGVESARSLAETGGLDVINTDASWVGGITGWLRVRDAAERFGLRVAHHAEPQLAMHLLAGRPDVGFVEIYGADRDPAWHQLVEPIPSVDGVICAPDAPGIGLEIDHTFAEHHTVNTTEVTHS